MFAFYIFIKDGLIIILIPKVFTSSWEHVILIKKETLIGLYELTLSKLFNQLFCWLNIWYQRYFFLNISFAFPFNFKTYYAITDFAMPLHQRLLAAYSFLYFYICIFYSLTDRPTDRIYTDLMLIDEGNLHRKNLTSILISCRENRVSPLNLTYGHTDGHLLLYRSINFKNRRFFHVYLRLSHFYIYVFCSMTDRLTDRIYKE